METAFRSGVTAWHYKSRAICYRDPSGAGHFVEMSLRDGRLIVEPLHPSSVTLEDLLKNVTPENLHDEIDTGRQGEEKCGRGVQDIRTTRNTK